MSDPLVPPIRPSAVYAFADLDELDAAYAAAPPGFVYARDGHPNGRELADQLNDRHGAAWGLVTASGMAATAAAVLPLVSTGDTVLASDQLYGKTNKLLAGELRRFGVETTFVDSNDSDAVAAALDKKTARFLYVETISNPNCRVADLPRLAGLCHQRNTLLIVDNTFATPTLCRPLELGADLIIESLTKFINGHSDVTLGYVGGRDAARGSVAGPAASTWGFHASPFDCWLVLRGLETLDLRIDAACANARQLAEWLGTQPGVSRVIYPGRTDHPDHRVAQQLLPRGFGHMLSVELRGGRDAVNRFMRAAPEIPFCPSLGHTTTTCSHPDTTSHRYESADAKRALGITPGVLRLSVGCESWDHLRRNMAKGLSGSVS